MQVTMSLLAGERRSGTNLLQLMLSISPAVYVAHFPPILKRLSPLVHLYDISRNGLGDLTDDVIRLIALDAVEWVGPPLHKAEIIERCNEPTLFGILSSILRTCAVDKPSASTILYKEGLALTWRTDIDRALLKPRYLVLVRDPRDVVGSFQREPSGDKHAYIIAKKWRDVYEACLVCGSELGKERFAIFTYESLLTETQRVVEEMSQFLNIPFSDSMLRHHEGRDAVRWSAGGTRWADLAKPLQPDNIRKYSGKLTDEQIVIIESVAGETMDKLGYDRKLVSKTCEVTYTPQDVARFENENEALKDVARSQLSPDRWEVSEPQIALLKDIHARLTKAS